MPSQFIITLMLIACVGCADAGTPAEIAKPVDKPGPVEPRLKPQPPDEWIDVSRDSAELQGQRLTVLGVSLKPGTYVNRSGTKYVDDEEKLLVRIRIDNLSETKKFFYQNWGSNAFDTSKWDVEDEHGNSYVVCNPTANLSAVIEGGDPTESVYPGESHEDVLVITRPVEAAKVLKIRLRAFGDHRDAEFRLIMPLSEMTPPPLAAQPAPRFERANAEDAAAELMADKQRRAEAASLAAAKRLQAERDAADAERSAKVIAFGQRLRREEKEREEAKQRGKATSRIRMTSELLKSRKADRKQTQWMIEIIEQFPGTELEKQAADLLQQLPALPDQ